ncbi:MAG: TonB-dependent receptor [Chitinophagales bacterium]|nr:TonB-dependent receptor [Chitinophagales bacterium]
MKRHFFVLAAAIFSNQLLAQQDTTLLGEAVVTANRYPVKTSLTGKVVTVISRAQLEQSGSKDLAQVLSEQAGIFIAGANSNTGKDKSVYLRGGYVAHTLITIDGIPVYDPSGIGGNFDLRNLSLAQIERIEILKGSQSTLYGSDAVNGVVNIITQNVGHKTNQNVGQKTSQNVGQKTNISQAGLSYGSYDTWRLQAGVNGATKKMNYNSSYSWVRSRGMDEAVNRGTYPQTDRDDYAQHNFQASAGFSPVKNLSVKPFFRFSKIKGALDQGAFTDELDYSYRQQSWQAGLRTEWIVKQHRFTLLYNYNDVNRRYTDDSVKSRNGFDTWSEGKYTGGEHFADLFWVMKKNKSLTITGGADLRASRSDQHYTSVGFFGPFGSTYSKDSLRQQQASVYTAVNWNSPSGFNLEAGSRLNLHSEYGPFPVFSLNPSFLLKQKVKFYANLSSAYRTPSLYQLFSEYGNAGLQPEAAITTEAGAQYYAPGNKWTARITGFNRDVRDIIFFYYNSSTFQSQYINQDRQHDYGVELEGSWQLNTNSSLRAWYTWVDGKISTVTNGKDTSYNNLLRRPRSSAGIQGSTRIGKRFLLNSNLQWNGKRRDSYYDNSSFSTVHATLDAYLLWNLYAEYGFSKNKLNVFADLRNITNSRYTEISGFTTARFNAYAGFRFQF